MTPDHYRILLKGERAGSIYRDKSLNFTGWIAEWRHFALEFDTLEQARAYVEADTLSTYQP